MRTIKLGEVSQVSSSKRIFAKQYVQSGIPFYRQKEIIEIENGNEISEPLFISEDLYENIKRDFGVPQKGELLITGVGVTLGIPYIVGDEKFYFKDGNLIWCKNFDRDVNSKYVYYWIKSDAGQKAIWSRTIGSAQPALTIDLVKQYELEVPEIDIQNKIVRILSLYDDLIENNQKQIKLLEEAAQRLYKEWFIDLHFPGYESTQTVDGVPEGWSNGTLGDIAIDAGKRETKDNRRNYGYYLPIDCLPRKSLSYQQMNDISLAESSLVAFKAKDILVGAMRPYFHKVVVARDNGLTRSTCFVINAKSKDMWEYLLMLLFDTDTIDYATQISVGTTMPYVRWKDFVNMPVLIPSIEVCGKFGEIVNPIITKANLLAEENIKIVEARDRLLPKLMSGELEL